LWRARIDVDHRILVSKKFEPNSHSDNAREKEKRRLLSDRVDDTMVQCKGAWWWVMRSKSEICL
jgi:hypothetical protein